MIKRLLVSLLILSVVCGNADEEKNKEDDVATETATETAEGKERIWYGEDALEGEFPFVARLYYDYGGDERSFSCGASIISSKVILTAAHCVGSSSAWILVGDHDNSTSENEAWHEIEAWYVHEEYNYNNSLANDIALGFLKEEIEFSEAVYPISLPTESDAWMYEEGQTVTLAGWGGTETEDIASTLQKLLIYFQSDETCKSYWGSWILPGMVCVHNFRYDGSHAWYGDSGGPFFATNADGEMTQLALTSYGSGNDTANDNVNTDILYYVKTGWLPGSENANETSSTCSMPYVEGGLLSPNSSTIEAGESYSLWCGDDYLLTGSDLMTCYGLNGKGYLSTSSSCTYVGYNQCDDWYYASVEPGRIASPAFPEHYPNNVDSCITRLYTDSDHAIVLDFEYFGLEHHSSCAWDYVEIRDGNSTDSTLLGKFCGGSYYNYTENSTEDNSTSYPGGGAVASFGSEMWIKFHSDEVVKKNGFLAYFSAFDPSNITCNQPWSNATGMSVSPSSPNVGYGESYEVSCGDGYLISGTRNESRTLTCGYNGNFDNEMPESCEEIRCSLPYVSNGTAISPNSTILPGESYNVSCYDSSYAINGSTSVTVECSDNGTLSETYLYCQYDYSDDCDIEHEATSTANSISSPGWPGNYMNSISSCVSTIYAEEGQQILLDFEEFNLESATGCRYDYLEIRDGDHMNATFIGRFCGYLDLGNDTSNGTSNSTRDHSVSSGNEPPQLVASSGNALWLKFHTDGSVTRGGYMAYYATFDPSVISCDKPSIPNGVVSPSNTSIGYGEHYDIMCYTGFNRTGNGTMKCDASGNLDQTIWCEEYVVVECSVPDIENGYASPNRTLEEGEYTYLYCNAGYNNSAVNNTGRSHGQAVSMRCSDDYWDYFADNVTDYFNCSAQNQCGDWLYVTPDKEKELTSPGYPSNYPRSVSSCETVLYTDTYRRQIQLVFQEFDLEYSSSCVYDYVEVRDGQNQTAPLLGRFCGSLNLTVASTGRYMWVKFHSDSSAQYNGFRASVESFTDRCYKPSTYDIMGGSVSPNVTYVDVGSSYDLVCWDGYDLSGDGVLHCGEDGELYNNTNTECIARSQCGDVLDVTSEPGQIMSPGYPSRYPNSVGDCVTKLYAAEGEQINVVFDSFRLEDHSTCAYDSLEVRDGDNSSAPYLGKYCGNRTGSSMNFTSSGNSIWFKFSSDGSVTYGGYSAWYSTVGSDESCEDKAGTVCAYWAQQGYCNSTHQYYSYMADNCTATCGLCEAGNDCDGDWESADQCHSMCNEKYGTDSNIDLSMMWLEGGESGNAGVVMLEPVNGQRSVLCKNGMGRNELNAICGELGYGEGMAVDASDYPLNIDLDWYSYGATDLTCSENAADLSDCSWTEYTDSAAPCFSGQEAAVSCSHGNESAWSFQVDYFNVKVKTSSQTGITKVKAYCSASARQYGVDIDPKKNMVGVLAHFDSNGTLEIVDDMKYKNSKGYFYRKYSSDAEEPNKNSHCFVCIVTTMNGDSNMDMSHIAYSVSDKCKYDVPDADFESQLRGAIALPALP